MRLLQTIYAFYSGVFICAFHKSKGPAGNIHAAGGTDFYDVRDGVTKETAYKDAPATTFYPPHKL